MLLLAETDIDDLAALLARWGASPGHARPLLRAFYERGGQLDLEALPLARVLKQRLRDEVLSRPLASRVAARHVSADGTTRLLIAFGEPSGGSAEAVLMPGLRDGVAAGCVSSQIGCAMGCDFCASTLRGLERNLSAGEITEQFLHLKRLSLSLGRRLRTIVFMGMGEPMHNLNAVLGAIRRIAHPDMGGLGWRQVTVSTVGVVPGIDQLAEADLNVHLALSLHAPDDETRSRLIPSNRRWPVAAVLEAARRFQQRTRRIVTIEYTLLAGINDSDEHAELLSQRMHGFRAHVNLIPYNPIGPGMSGKVYQRPSFERTGRFLEILRKRGVVAHLRHPRGDDVSAACGQLRMAEIGS